MVARIPWRREGTAAAAAMAALLAGCFVGSSSSNSSGSSGSGPASGGGSGGGASSGQPLLVVVDTGQTLTAEGGLGVGVFTEYRAGGHWHVWWACDTGVTQLPCQFRVDASVATGTISSVTSELTSTTAPIAQTSPSEITATTSTTTGVDGVRFDTTPGATITLDAQINGAENGAFLFFVQAGTVNGGYKGAISDPLMLQPSSP